MNTCVLAVVGRPLFGSLGLAVLVVMLAIAALLAAVALAGRWLAATHPDAPDRPIPAPAVAADPSPETLAIIACAVTAAFGARARVTAVSLAPPHAPSVEALMLQWSLEGRRQIYTSHKVR